MNEYKPNEKVLKQIINDMPDEVKTQIKLSKLITKDDLKFSIIIQHKDHKMYIDMNGTEDNMQTGAALLKSPLTAISTASELLNVPVDLLLMVIHDTADAVQTHITKT